VSVIKSQYPADAAGWLLTGSNWYHYFDQQSRRVRGMTFPVTSPCLAHGFWPDVIPRLIPRAEIPDTGRLCGSCARYFDNVDWFDQQGNPTRAYVATCDAGDCERMTLGVMLTREKGDRPWLSMCAQHVLELAQEELARG
jgi:hypothetical protein